MLPAGVAPTHRLSTPDLLIVGVYLVAISLFGLSFRSKSRSLKGYFLADRKIAWWAIALSIVAAETSTLTIISVPGLAFTGDWGFLQIVLGYLLGRIVVCILFLPRYFRGELLTAYEVIGQRSAHVFTSSRHSRFSSCARQRKACGFSPSQLSLALQSAPMMSCRSQSFACSR